jgi:hypothetical protein
MAVASYPFKLLVERDREKDRRAAHASNGTLELSGSHPFRAAVWPVVLYKEQTT